MAGLIGLFFVLVSLLFSCAWLTLLVWRRKGTVVGLGYETLMFFSVASSVLAAIFLRIATQTRPLARRLHRGRPAKEWYLI